MKVLYFFDEKATKEISFSSNLPTLHLLHDALGEAVNAFGVVFFFERRAVEPRESLIETGFHRAENGLDEAVGSAVALAIDEFDEEFSLRIGQFLHARRVSFLDVGLDEFQMLVASFFVGQSLEIFVGLADDLVTFLRNRQHFFHVIDEAVVLLSLLLVFEGRGRINVDVLQLDILNRIAVGKGFSDFHHRLEGRRVHIDSSVFGIHSTVVLGDGSRSDEANAEQEKDSFHCEQAKKGLSEGCLKVLR